MNSRVIAASKVGLVPRHSRLEPQRRGTFHGLCQRDLTSSSYPITMALKEMPPLLSEQEMKDAKIPLQWRDRCAAILVPLNKCRRESAYLPWKCSQLRHDYEECQYLDFQRRVQEFEAQKKAAAQ